MSNELICKIYECAENLGMKAKINIKKNNSKPWFDSECLKCKKSTKELLNKCKKKNFVSVELVAEYTQKRKEYKNLQKYKKDEN